MIALTFDQDWAPDWMCIEIANQLKNTKTPATFLITHSGSFLDYLRKNSDLFEIGIHPNFSPSSTQGKNPTEVLAQCLKWVPEAKTFRTHQMIQSTPLLFEIINDGRLKYDLSIYLNNLLYFKPFELISSEGKLLRFPTIWEDDLELINPSPTGFSVQPQGIQLLCFHPIHLYLNSANLANYTKMKEKLLNLKKQLTEASRADLENFRNSSNPHGVQNWLDKVIDSTPKTQFFTVQGLAEEVRAS